MKISIEIGQGSLSELHQTVVNDGFSAHSEQRAAPAFEKTNLHWVAFGEEQELVGVVTADLLWDWMYIDELWVSESLRGEGLGKRLMLEAEAYATEVELSGVWLWTQSWQAEGFYRSLGYEEFTRFSNFPKGHERIGFRKAL